MTRDRNALKGYLFFAFALVIMIGGFFQPLLGLAVPVLLALAIALSFARKRPFCSRVCPRAGILSHVVSRWSRYRQMPAYLYSQGVRNALCAFLLICAVGQTSRLWPEFRAVGNFFWIVCVLTFVLSVAMGIIFKPRSWCAVCPLGTLQSTLNEAAHGGGPK